MATLQEIQAAMVGFSHNLTWREFRSVAVSPRPPMMASTAATWRSSPWSVHVVDSEYRVHGARVTVALNANGSWALPAARTSATLLQHEQGHYDITALIARDWISKVLDLSFGVDTVASLNDSGKTANDHLRYVFHQFEREITQFKSDADTLMARLQTDPTTGQEGLYDSQTNHSQNTAGQQIWNTHLQRIKAGNDSFELSLRLEGVI
jgi:hypothetical protein